MNRRKKNLLVLAISFVCIIAAAFGTAAFAAPTPAAPSLQPLIEGRALYSDPSFDIVAAKTDLADAHSDEYMELTEEESAERSEMLENLIMSGLPEEELNAKLEEVHVYPLEIPEEQKGEYVSSDQSYVTLYEPKLYYDSARSYWGIYARGVYNRFPDDICWLDVFWPTVGKRYSIGGTDGYGFAIEDTSGTYSASLKSKKCIISTASAVTGGTTKTATASVPGSGRYGVAFQMQDEAIITKSNIINYSYIYLGYSFGCIGWYTDNFKTYRGNVATIFAHTYDDCGVGGITFGAEVGTGGISANCEISYTRNNHKYDCGSTDMNLYTDGFGKPKTQNPNSIFNP